MNHVIPLMSLIIAGSFNLALAENLGIPTLGRNSELIPITIKYDEHSTIFADQNSIQVGIMNSLEDGLYAQGYTTQMMSLYKVVEVTVIAKSKSNNAQVKLCSGDDIIGCNQVREAYIPGNRRTFKSRGHFNTISIFDETNRFNLDLPIEVEISGVVKLSEITVLLEPLFLKGEGRPNPTPIYHPPIEHHYPSFLYGKTIFENSDRPVQIGEKMKLEKNPLGEGSALKFSNQNVVFANFNWVNITSLESPSMIDIAIMNCLDEKGQESSTIALDEQGNQIRYFRLGKGSTLTFQVAQECKYIQSISMYGTSLGSKVSRALITVDLN